MTLTWCLDENDAVKTFQFGIPQKFTLHNSLNGPTFTRSDEEINANVCAALEIETRKKNLN